MAHNRKFVPGIVALVKERIKNTKLVIQVQDEIEKLIVESHFLDSAPFKWVGLIYRYGLKNKLKPEYQRINKKYGDLPIAVELDTRVLQWADQNNLQLFKDIFIIAALEALLDVGQKYNLPTDLIAQERSKYVDIPNSVEELEGNL
ncbi:MAG: immunity protein 39 [Alphaproteobacteria bacterium]|nr:immunity protein 39 [Alphaproteobacteria bacterium]